MVELAKTVKHRLEDKGFGIPADLPTRHHSYFITSNFVFIAPWGKAENILVLCSLIGLYIGLNTY